MVVGGALNLVLVFFVFITIKNKPYLAAALFASIKSTLFFFLSKDLAMRMGLSTGPYVALSLFIGCIYAGIASAFIYFVGRLNRPRTGEQETQPTYSVTGSDKISFRWEVIPLIALLLLLLVL